MSRSKPPQLSLLAIDDDPVSLELIQTGIAQPGLDIAIAKTPTAGLKLFAEKRPQIVILDVMLPEQGGMEVLRELVAMDPSVEVLMVTAHHSPQLAIEAVENGATDCIPKPLNLTKLRTRIDSLLAEARRRQRALELDEELVSTFQFEGIIGRSPQMLEVFDKIRRIGPHFYTVLIVGETGTGKELVARALRQQSPRRSAPFAVCNCSAIAETLYEGELFGYVKGAFTGANHDKVGLFEYAQGGVVFLDEIGDMPLSGQAKLLRVLQNQEVQRVGSPTPRKVDVCVVAATNRDLPALVRENKFREDLYYRLSMLEIELPRLSDRREDLPLLQRFFVEKFSLQYKKEIRGVTRRAQAALARFLWPGNVRELENVIGNACLMVDGPVIDLPHLPARIRDAAAAPAARNVDAAMNGSDIMEGLPTLEELQRRYLLRVMKHVDGDKTRAAQILGIGRATVYSMLAKMGNGSTAGKTATAE